MPIVFLNAKNEVVRIHYQPSMLEDDQKVDGIEVDTIPDPEQKEGKKSVLKYTSEDGLFYEYVERPLRDKERIERLERENSDVKMALIEQDMLSQEEITSLKQSLIELDMELQAMKGSA
ncbi:hypothetical protein [Salimicrobium halophilum]|uniref:Bacteriophage SP-beta YorD domain-containing protein n=1 Tax=Salimicrobium halophilum TaxID=86666 RepID=A0A1G8WCS9_9BACI|nr:hypothetical protein [Salimicrobium halophilum]SDJ76044.1 hypothetical protein SAMN04490247_3118 [Salimicrobium halophilum]